MSATWKYKPCKNQLCGRRHNNVGQYCTECIDAGRAPAPQPMARKRPSAAKRGYDRTHRRMREAQLKRDPFCCMCKKRGKLVPAVIADHIIPHRGDEKLMRDPNNLQSLCKRCHDSDKQRIEKSGARQLNDRF